MRTITAVFLISTCFLLGTALLSRTPDTQVEVYDVRSFSHPSYTRIVIDVGSLREYAFNELRSPDRVYIDIYQARLNPILHHHTILIDSHYIQRIRMAQKSPSTVRIVADVNFSRVKRYQVFPLLDPFRIVLDIYPDKTASVTDSTVFSQPAQPTEEGYSLVRQLGLGVQKIVIDPGHGGKDPGCIGKTGLKEKEVVLDVCIRLKKLLEQDPGLQIILTRESDIYVPLESRTVVANQQQADLYISVHANANQNRKRSGVESFYLNFSTDPTVNEIAARENATSSKNISKMKEIILKIVQNSKIEESRALAQSIQKQLVRHLSKKFNDVQDLGVKGGPFWVLIGAEMPSVLVEISHLSNQIEEARLNSPQYRQEIAQGIYAGILSYIKSLGKG